MTEMRLILTVEQNGVRRTSRHTLTPGILTLAADSLSDIMAFAAAHLAHKLAKEFAELNPNEEIKVLPENADKDIEDRGQNSTC